MLDTLSRLFKYRIPLPSLDKAERRNVDMYEYENSFDLSEQYSHELEKYNNLLNCYNLSVKIESRLDYKNGQRVYEIRDYNFLTKKLETLGTGATPRDAFIMFKNGCTSKFIRSRLEEIELRINGI